MIAHSTHTRGTMDFSLAFIKNSQQFMLQNYSDSSETTKSQHLDLAELKNKSVQAIFIPQTMTSDEEVTELLSRESLYSPLKSVETTSLNENDFDNLAKEEAKNIFIKTHNSWVLQNNISLLKNLIPTTNHLKSMWESDRTAFFEELWHLLKRNLGAKSIRIAYNHMIKAQKEGEKNKLIRVVVEGDKKPEPIENKELGEKLFSNYEGHFSTPFTCHDIDDPQHSVMLASINESPVIVMSEAYEINPVQIALLHAFFDALQMGAKK